MRKVIAIGLCCFASSAFAQVGLGGGVVGTLGANGAASRVGARSPAVHSPDASRLLPAGRRAVARAKMTVL